MAISKRAIKRNLNIRKDTSVAKHSTQNPASMPWTDLFLDYGYSRAAIPTDNPPNDMSYGQILTWVTQDKWELPDDSNLAIDIWMGRVSLYDYTPTPKGQNQGLENKKGGDPSGNPTNLKPKNRFMKKSKQKDNAPPGPTF
jgi:hypothetical protein